MSLELENLELTQTGRIVRDGNSARSGGLRSALWQAKLPRMDKEQPFVMACICLAQGEALLGGMALLEEVCHGCWL